MEVHVVACKNFRHQGVACKLLLPIYNAKSMGIMLKAWGKGIPLEHFTLAFLV